MDFTAIFPVKMEAEISLLLILLLKALFVNSTVYDLLLVKLLFKITLLLPLIYTSPWILLFSTVLYPLRYKP